MNSFLNNEIEGETNTEDIKFLKNSSSSAVDDETSASAKCEAEVKIADGDSKTTSYYSRHHSWKKKSFADIVRKTRDGVENPKADSCGDVGNEACSLFESIDNISVRSVLENLFKEPGKNPEGQFGNLMSLNYAPKEDKETSTSAVGKLQTNASVFGSNGIQVESILKNIFHEDKSRTKEETNGNGNVFNFRYNLSDLLYERPRSSESSLQPSTYFVCPRCGEVTNFGTNDLEGLGSVGDRCLTTFRRFRKGQKTECGNRRIIACNTNQTWTPDYSWGGRSRSSFQFHNPFSGLNQKKRNRYKEQKRE